MVKNGLLAKLMMEVNDNHQMMEKSDFLDLDDKLQVKLCQLL